MHLACINRANGETCFVDFHEVGEIYRPPLKSIDFHSSAEETDIGYPNIRAFLKSLSLEIKENTGAALSSDL